MSTSSTLSTRLPSGWPRQSLIGRPSRVALRGGDDLGGVAFVLAVDLAQGLGEVALLLGRRRIRRQAVVDEIVEAGELAQTDLAAEFVEARHAVLAVADDVERRHVDDGVEPRAEVEVLQELRMIAQFQQAEPLAPDRQRPVGEAARAHGAGRLAAEGVDDRDVLDDLVGIGQLAVLDHVRHQRMQPVDRDELLGEVERRAEMVGAVVDAGRVGAVAGGADNAGAGGKRRIELVRQFRIGGVGELAHDALGDIGDVRTCRGTGRTSWSSCRDRAARRRAVAGSTRWCGFWRSPPPRSGARSRTAGRWSPGCS